MAISLIASIAQAQNASNPSTSAIDTTGANLLIAIVHYRAASGGGTIADSKGNSWTGLTPRENSTNAGIRIYYATNSPTVGSGHTLTLTGDFATIELLAFSGAHATAPFDVENGAAADSSGASIQPGSVAPSEDGSVIVVGLTEGNDPGGGGPSINSGFSTPVYTVFSSPSRGGAASYLIQTTAAAVNPTWTVSGVLEYATEIAVFKPSGADTTAPTLSGFQTNIQGDEITATLSEAGCTPASGTGGFTLSGTSATVSGWAISGTTLTLTLSGAIAFGETVTLDYDDAGASEAIADAVDNLLADIADAAVTNNVPDELTAGTASFVSSGPDGISVESDSPAGGVAPYTYQWERSTTSGSGFSNLSGATSLTHTDTTASPGTLYYYRLVVTDDDLDTATSNEVSAQIYEGGPLTGSAFPVIGDEALVY